MLNPSPKPEIEPTSSAAAASGRRRLFTTIGVMTLGVSLFILLIALLRPERNGLAKDGDDGHEKMVKKEEIFKEFPRDDKGKLLKPHLVLVFSGQTIGYMQPCGCSEPQYGGLARRYQFLEFVRGLDWPVVALDLGDNAPAHMSGQGLLKYRYIMRGLELMRYGAVGLGKNEFLAPFELALSQHTLDNHDPPVVATSLKGAEPEGVWSKTGVNATHVITKGGIKIGVLSVLGPTVEAEVAKQTGLGIKKEGAALAEGLKDLQAKKVHIGVLLFHGDEAEATAVTAQAYKLHKEGMGPLLHAVVYLSPGDPGDSAKQIRDIPTQIVTAGEKGKNLGLLAFYNKPAGLEMHYKRVAVSPEFQPTPAEALKSPLTDLWQKYADDLKAKNFLSPRMTPRSPHPTQVALGKKEEASYVGSERCKSCHEEAYKVWKKSKHAHAFETLEVAKFPSGRQYDPECILCHTVGFKHERGYADPADVAAIDKHNARLRGVGCESCHGPASMHVKNPAEEKYYPLINPYGARAGARRFKLIEWNLCLKCHDDENDVHWRAGSFDKKWKEIAHPTPPDERRTAEKE